MCVYVCVLLSSQTRELKDFDTLYDRKIFPAFINTLLIK
jgi:hypothetical protein